MGWATLLCFCLAVLVNSCLGQDPADQKTYIVSALKTQPFLVDKEGTDGYEGFFPDLLDEIAELLGVKFEIRIAKDNRSGSLQKDGRWSGVIGELTRKEAGVGGLVTITSRRERVVDFAKPVLSTGLAIAYRGNTTTPTRVTDGVLLVFRPFSYAAWLLIVFFAVLVALLLMCYKACLGISSDPNSSVGARMRSALSKKGSMSWAAKVLMFFAVSCALLTMCLYVAALTRLMAAPRVPLAPVTKFESLDDLMKDGEVPIGAVWGGAEEMFLRSSRVAVYQKLYDMVSNGPEIGRPKSYEEAIELTKRGYAVVMDGAILTYYLQQECDLEQIGVRLTANAYSIATALGSDLRDQLSLAVLQLRESGVIQKLLKKWTDDRGQCPSKPKSSKTNKSKGGPPFQKLGVQELATPFILLALGCVISVLVAIVEKVCCSKPNEKDRV